MLLDEIACPMFRVGLKNVNSFDVLWITVHIRVLGRQLGPSLSPPQPTFLDV